MDRVVRQDYAEAISAAMRTIPVRMHSLLRSPHFLCGTDPVFAGLHRFVGTDDGRNYRDTAHCVYPFHQTHLARADRRTTIVLPTPVRPWVIVHELGHVLHETLGFQPVAKPVTEYAKTNRHEAFAEALCSYLFHGYGSDPDPATTALLDSLGS